MRVTPPVVRAGGEANPATRLLVGGSLLIGAGLAWAWTASLGDMPGCHQTPLGPFLGMWTVMMAAMMFPAMIPVVLAFALFTRSRDGNASVAATLFVAGYLVVWGLLGVPAHAIERSAAAVVAALPGLAPHAGRIGGALLVLCGLYQLTPFKDACLRHCQMPHLFLGHHWRDGFGGALLMGAQHGLYCAGCCASIMVVLLVVGVMDMTWMVGLSALIFLEKALPAGRGVGRVAGLLLCAAGAARLAG